MKTLKQFGEECEVEAKVGKKKSVTKFRVYTTFDLRKEAINWIKHWLSDLGKYGNGKTRISGIIDGWVTWATIMPKYAKKVKRHGEYEERMMHNINCFVKFFNIKEEDLK